MTCRRLVRQAARAYSLIRPPRTGFGKPVVCRCRSRSRVERRARFARGAVAGNRGHRRRDRLVLLPGRQGHPRAARPAGRPQPEQYAPARTAGTILATCCFPGRWRSGEEVLGRFYLAVEDLAGGALGSSRPRLWPQACPVALHDIVPPDGDLRVQQQAALITAHQLEAVSGPLGAKAALTGLPGGSWYFARDGLPEGVDLGNQGIHPEVADEGRELFPAEVLVLQVTEPLGWPAPGQPWRFPGPCVAA